MKVKKQNFGLSIGVSAVALAVSQAVSAGTAPYFIPLTHSEGVTVANSIDEISAPFQAPAGMTQRNLTSLLEVESDVLQDMQRVPGGGNSSMFDMLAYDPTGRYIFIPHETAIGAGVTRYDTVDDDAQLIFAGNQLGAGPDGIRDTEDDDWTNDYGAFDPSRWTPNGTIIAAEEWAGRGRVVEIMDPMATPADPTAGGSELVEGEDYRILNSIASVSHEGINFSEQHPNDIIYFIDESRSGSIYKLVLKESGNYPAGGQTFVLKSQAFLDAGGDPTLEYRDAPNTNPGVKRSRFGLSTWEPITDADGNPLTETNPFDPPAVGCGSNDAEDECRDSEIRPGRIAADEVGGTPWGRPEDMTIDIAANGNEMLFISITSENSVISIEETAQGPYVRPFATGDATENNIDESGAATPTNVGFEPTLGFLNAPDNVAVDALGNIYIIEDAPNRSSTGGDIWFARDMDADGIAESLDHFLSIQVQGAESTGMIFNPMNPAKFVVAVQHPTSTALGDDGVDGFDGDGNPIPAGIAGDGERDMDSLGMGGLVQDMGDAVWEFDLSGVAPPPCNGDRRAFKTVDPELQRDVKTCSESLDLNFHNLLRRSERFDGTFPTP